MDSTSSTNTEGGSQSSDRLRWFLLGKGRASVLSLVMTCAVLSPVGQNWRQEPRDSFPLSYYPMFSAKRAEEGRVTYIVGFDAEGTRYTIPYKYAGVGGFNQTRRQIRKLVRQGEAAQLCRSVASRIAGGGKRRVADVTTVRIVTGSYRVADYFSGDKTPVSETVHASCAVERGES